MAVNTIVTVRIICSQYLRTDSGSPRRDLSRRVACCTRQRGRKKPTQRLLAAVPYKYDVTQTELAEWYGVQRRTIYSWLTRLDTDEPLEQAVTDAH